MILLALLLLVLKLMIIILILKIRTVLGFCHAIWSYLRPQFHTIGSIAYVHTSFLANIIWKYGVNGQDILWTLPFFINMLKWGFTIYILLWLVQICCIMFNRIIVTVLKMYVNPEARFFSRICMLIITRYLSQAYFTACEYSLKILIFRENIPWGLHACAIGWIFSKFEFNPKFFNIHFETIFWLMFLCPIIQPLVFEMGTEFWALFLAYGGKDKINKLISYVNKIGTWIKNIIFY